SWDESWVLDEVQTRDDSVMYRTFVIVDLPVKSEKTVKTPGDTVVETETLTYETLPHPVSPVPGVKTVTVVRDGTTFTTTYTYASNDWANYGQPTQIVQAGSKTRTTNITYQHGFGKYIRGRVASVATTVDGQTSTRSFTYNGTNGFMTAATDL